MPIFNLHKDIQPVFIARYLVIFILVALLFSPPLTNLFELTLFGMFITIAELRKRMLIALKQPLVTATLLFYLLILLVQSKFPNFANFLTKIVIIHKALGCSYISKI